MPGTDCRFAALAGNVVQEALNTLKTGCLKSKDIMSKIVTVRETVEFFAFSPDGTLLAVFFRISPMIRVYECKTGRQLLILRMYMMPGVLDMAFSPDNSIFAIYGDRVYLIHRLTRLQGSSGRWCVEQIRSIERKYTVNVSIMAKEVGISFSNDNTHVVFQEVSVDLKRGRAKGIKVRYEDVDISFPRDFFDQERGVETNVIRWNATGYNRHAIYAASRFELVDFFFTAGPNRTYIPPGCISNMFGVVLSSEKSLSRMIFVDCEHTGKLVAAKPSACGRYLLELRSPQSPAHLIRKVDMRDLEDVDLSELPIPATPAPMKVVGFLVNGSIAVVIFSGFLSRTSSAVDSGKEISVFIPHGWAVYDTRHSRSFYTTFKQSTCTEYQAAKESLALSWDGQLLGLTPVRQGIRSHCEYHVFNVSNGLVSQVREVETCCYADGQPSEIFALENCHCRNVIGSCPDASISTFSRTYRKMSFVWTVKKKNRGTLL
ncbi:unnamed protein product [Agarophyton chilense]